MSFPVTNPPNPSCPFCDGTGYRWRVPDGFNPFSAGGWNTVNAMYRVTCGCSATSTQSADIQKAGDA